MFACQCVDILRSAARYILFQASTSQCAHVQSSHRRTHIKCGKLTRTQACLSSKPVYHRLGICFDIVRNAYVNV